MRGRGSESEPLETPGGELERDDGAPEAFDEEIHSVGSAQVLDLEPDEEEDAKTRLADAPLRPQTRPSDGLADPTPTRSARGRAKSVPPAKDRRIGQVLSGRYRLEKLIGKGGMGRVYLATQFPLNRAVAVKILNPDFQRKDPQFVRRFFLEAATAARLSHPNTITVFDYGETDRKELYIAMEYLKGRPLSRVLVADGPFPAERAIHVTMQIVRALREAHSKGIIHRDLKPGNIMLLEEGDDADYAKVLDFGLVKLINQAEHGNVDLLTPSQQGDDLTRAGMFLGSPKYMSPEQIQGTDLDPRTDIYSLGVIMYQMITGRPPFRGSTSVEIIYKHVNQPVPRPHDLNPDADAPPEIEEVILRCLSKSREERYASMTDLLAALKEARRAITGVVSATGSGLLTGEFSRIRPSEIASAADPLARDPSSPSMPPREAAAFLEPGLSGPSATVDEPRVSDAVGDASIGSVRPLRPSSALLRAAPYVAGLSLVVVLGALTYVISSTPTEVPVAPPPVAVPEPTPPTVARVVLGSSPEGAAVTENGRLLGVTPFELELPREATPTTHEFVFTREGYLDEVVREEIDSDSVKIVASLRKRPAPVVAPPAAEPEPDPEPRRSTRRPATRRPSRPAKKPTAVPDYKDNPY